jgi:hypothetical protein
MPIYSGPTTPPKDPRNFAALKKALAKSKATKSRTPYSWAEEIKDEKEATLKDLIPGFKKDDAVAIRIMDKNGDPAYFCLEDESFTKNIYAGIAFTNAEELLGALAIIRKELAKFNNRREADEEDVSGDYDDEDIFGGSGEINFSDLVFDSIELCLIEPQITPLDLKDTPLRTLISERVLNEMTAVDAKALGIENYLVLKKLKRK